jgi:hypothetical protein
MRIQFATAAAILAIGLAGTAFAQPQYSSDYSNDSDGFAPAHMAATKPIHGVDKMTTGSIRPLPDCADSAKHGMVNTRGGDSGASHTDACRDVGDK